MALQGLDSRSKSEQPCFISGLSCGDVGDVVTDIAELELHKSKDTASRKAVRLSLTILMFYITQYESSATLAWVQNDSHIVDADAIDTRTRAGERDRKLR